MKKDSNISLQNNITETCTNTSQKLIYDIKIT